MAYCYKKSKAGRYIRLKTFILYCGKEVGAEECSIVLAVQSMLTVK